MPTSKTPPGAGRKGSTGAAPARDAKVGATTGEPGGSDKSPRPGGKKRDADVPGDKAAAGASAAGKSGAQAKSKTPGPSTVKGKAAVAEARRERVRQQQLAARRAERRKLALVWGAAGALALVLVVAIVAAIVTTVLSRPDLGVVKKYEDLGREHVTGPVTYTPVPPVGGDHRAQWLNCGVYTQPVPDVNAVHALEHGAVWVTYRPNLPADQIKKLQESLPGTYMVMSPYPDIDAAVIASAWGSQIKVDRVDDPRLAAFIREYRLGPQTPEPGAACTGGLDAPGKVA